MGGRAQPTGLSIDDREPDQLDDESDREELRQRYYGLLQEVRVLLPGVQILFAFLFTIPFATGFKKLDAFGRDIYGVSLFTAFAAVVLFVAPTALHRMGERRARVVRLVWSIWLCRAGVAFLGASLVSGLVLVTRDVFGAATAIVVGSLGLGLVAVVWFALPTVAGHKETAADMDRLTTGRG
jgi:hypothetical protein